MTENHPNIRAVSGDENHGARTIASAIMVCPHRKNSGTYACASQQDMWSKEGKDKPKRKEMAEGRARVSNKTPTRPGHATPLSIPPSPV